MTVVVEGPIAFRMRRWAAAARAETGVQICTLPMLAARLAGGFYRPAGGEELEPAIARALDAGGFADLASMCKLPGMTRAVARTLTELWSSDVSLESERRANSRLADLALIEQRTREALPIAVLSPRELRDAAMSRLQHASAVLGSIVLDRLSDVPRVWRPLIAALQETVETRWIDPGIADAEWFAGRVEGSPSRCPLSVSGTVVSCADPHAEVIESLRWARELMASGQARPEEIAICAASTQLWDEHFLTLVDSSDLPVHFSAGRPALSTRSGQACGALADILLNGLSQDRVRRLLSYSRGDVPNDWLRGLQHSATLHEVDQWRHALADALTRLPQRIDPAPVLLPILELLSQGAPIAVQAGKTLLDAPARALWERALSSAPAQALEFSLQTLRVPDQTDPCSSVVWGPASHLVGAPRPCVRLLGANGGYWPRRATEDPLLPEHLRTWPTIEADSVTNRDRRAFQRLMASASRSCVVSLSRRDGQGRPLSASPLISADKATLLTRGRIPEHAFSEADRLMARPREAVQSPRIARSFACWRAWDSADLTSHDGLVRAEHPLIQRATARVQSATSLRLMLRDPLVFVWRYALGWHAPFEEEEPLILTDRARGELVHELLRRAVSSLEPQPGYSNATRAEIQSALQAAVQVVREQWPLQRSIPPKLLWEHTLLKHQQLAYEALTFETINPKTRCWTEVPFGHEEEISGEWPWDPRAPVTVPDAGVQIRGRIDRVDWRWDGKVLRVSDYKTGAAPQDAESLILGGGIEIQRVIYAIAARALLPDVPQVAARLVYLGGDVACESKLQDIDGAIKTIANRIVDARNVLHQGRSLPHTRDRTKQKEDDEFDLALPADMEAYITRKGDAFRQAFGDDLVSFWEPA